MTSLTRWYIDTRHLTSSTEDLPLIETLQPTEQTSVKKYLRLPDRHMSLASSLLKYFFIHKTCRIPWSEVTISRTPKPHQRPCFIPAAGHTSTPAVEFNVSHQASFVALGGCRIPSSPQENDNNAQNEGEQQQHITAAAAVYSDPKPSSAPVPSIPQVGIDITCVDEPGRRRDKLPKTLKEVGDFIDIFSEVFSHRELDTMKQYGSNLLLSKQPLETVIKSTLRLFYAYWALKEAYIKMTGEALLAKWLRELEFTDVVAPAPTAPGTEWSEPYAGVQTWLYGKKVEDVRVELVAFESDYLVATAARGANLGSNIGAKDNDPWQSLESIDIERDVRPCATGACQCLL
jgi:4'-phosphopantetheinyl transferase